MASIWKVRKSKFASHVIEQIARKLTFWSLMTFSEIKLIQHSKNKTKWLTLKSSIRCDLMWKKPKFDYLSDRQTCQYFLQFLFLKKLNFVRNEKTIFHVQTLELSKILFFCQFFYFSFSCLREDNFKTVLNCCQTSFFLVIQDIWSFKWPLY